MRSKYPPRHYRYPLFRRYTHAPHAHVYVRYLTTFRWKNAKRGSRGAVCRSRNSSINNPGPRQRAISMVLAIHALARTRARARQDALIRTHTRECARARAHSHLRDPLRPPSSSSTKQTRKPASPRSHARDGLSDLHARQVRRASESVYYVFNSRVSHTRRVTIPADFHNATRAPEKVPPRDRRRPYFLARGTDRPDRRPFWGAFTRVPIDRV